MKKIIAILAVLMLLPFTAFGLETLSEDVLDDVTGQAGVSIGLDVNVNMTMETLAWGDSDGLGAGTDTTEGWIGMSDLTIENLRIRIDSHQGGDLALFTIDVATATTETANMVYDPTAGPSSDGAFVAETTDPRMRAAGTTFVRIGLGSLLMTMDSMTADVELAANAAAFAGTTDKQMMGTMTMTDFAMAIDAISYVDISAHGGSGVTIDLAVRINSITMAACSWGDKDGLGDPTTDNMEYNGLVGDAYGLAGQDPAHSVTPHELILDASETSAGYVGLKDMSITNLVITGQVLIDVATIGTGTVGATGPSIAYIYNTIQAQTGNEAISNTGVIIRLNDLAISMDEFKADIALSDSADLAGDLTTGQLAVMGSILIQNMDVNVNGWVLIGAH